VNEALGFSVLLDTYHTRSTKTAQTSEAAVTLTLNLTKAFTYYIQAGKQEHNLAPQIPYHIPPDSLSPSMV